MTTKQTASKCRVLYTAGEIHAEIKRLFENPKPGAKRVAVVAYVGGDAESFLPSPKGVRIICSPSPVATSYEALRSLEKRGAKIEFSQRLHSKVYWSEGRGCLITSANLSRRALAVDGLKEAGVILGDSAVDIERLIKVAAPSRPTPKEWAKLRKAQAIARLALARAGIKEVGDRTLADWLEASERSTWKIGWYTGPVKAAKEAKAKSALKYGRKQPSNWTSCAAGSVRAHDWLLSVEIRAGGAGDIDWMYCDFVVDVKRTEKGVFEADYPRQAVQVHSLKRCPEPPFKLTREVRAALRAAINGYGTERIMARKSLVPPLGLLKRLSAQ